MLIEFLKWYFCITFYDLFNDLMNNALRFGNYRRLQLWNKGKSLKSKMMKRYFEKIIIVFNTYFLWLMHPVADTLKNDKTLFFVFNYQFALQNLRLFYCHMLLKKDNLRLFLKLWETDTHVKSLPRGILGLISSKTQIGST